MDYIFFRIYLFYKKKNDLPLLTGLLFLLVLKVCILFFLVTLFNIFTGGLLSNHNPDLIKNSFWIAYAIILFVSFIFDILRYSKTEIIKRLDTKYHNKKINYLLKNWHIFIIPIIILFFSIFLNVLFNSCE